MHSNSIKTSQHGEAPWAINWKIDLSEPSFRVPVFFCVLTNCELFCELSITY